MRNLLGINRSFIHYYITWIFFLLNFLKINKNFDVKKTKYPFFAVFNRSFFNRNLLSYNTANFFPHSRFFITKVIKLVNKISYKTKNDDFGKKINFLNPDIKLFFQSYEIILYIAFKYGFRGRFPNEYMFVDEKIIMTERFLSNIFYLNWREKLVDPKFLIFTSFIESFSNFDKESMYKIAKREFNLANNVILSRLYINSKDGYLITLTHLLRMIFFDFEGGKSVIFWHRIREFMNTKFSKKFLNKSSGKNIQRFFWFIRNNDPVQSKKYWIRKITEIFMLFRLEQDSDINIFDTYKFSVEKLLLLQFIFEKNKKSLNNLKLEDLVYNLCLSDSSKHNFRSILNFIIFLATTDILKFPYTIMHHAFTRNYPVSVLYSAPLNFDRNYHLKKSFRNTLWTEDYSERCFRSCPGTLIRPGDKKFLYDTLYNTRITFNKDKFKTTMFQYTSMNSLKMVDDEIIDILSGFVNFEMLNQYSKDDINRLYDQIFYQDYDLDTSLLQLSNSGEIIHSIEFDDYVFDVNKFNDKKSTNFRTQVSVNLQEKILDKFFENKKSLNTHRTYEIEKDKEIMFRRNKKSRCNINSVNPLRSLNIKSNHSRLSSIRDDLLNNMINSKAIITNNNVKKNEDTKKINYPENFLSYSYMIVKLNESNILKEKDDITKEYDDVVDCHFRLVKRQRKEFFINSTGMQKYRLYFIKTRDSAKRNFYPHVYKENNSLRNEEEMDICIEKLIFKKKFNKFNEKYDKIKKRVKKSIKLPIEKSKPTNCNLRLIEKLMNSRNTDKIYYKKTDQDVAKKCLNFFLENKDKYLSNKGNLSSYKLSYVSDLKLIQDEKLILDQYFYLKKYNLAYKIALFLIKSDITLQMAFDLCCVRSYYYFLFNFQQSLHKSWNMGKSSDIPFYLFVTSYMLVLHDLDHDALMLYPPLLFDLLILKGGKVSEILKQQKVDYHDVKRMELIEKKLKFSLRRQELKFANYASYEMTLLLALKFALNEYVNILKGRDTGKFMCCFEALVSGLQYQTFSLKTKKLAEKIYNKISRRTILRMTRLFIINYSERNTKEDCKKILSKLMNFFNFDIRDLKIILSKRDI